MFSDPMFDLIYQGGDCLVNFRGTTVKATLNVLSVDEGEVTFTDADGGEHVVKFNFFDDTRPLGGFMLVDGTEHQAFILCPTLEAIKAGEAA